MSIANLIDIWYNNFIFTAINVRTKVNDYVRWTTALGMVHEGWVYFKAEPSEIKKDGKHLQDIFQLKLQQNQDHSVISAHFYIKIFMYVYVVMNQIGTN